MEKTLHGTPRTNGGEKRKPLQEREKAGYGRNNRRRSKRGNKTQEEDPERKHQEKTE